MLFSCSSNLEFVFSTVAENKLFTKFERLDIEKNSTTEGTGLGLAITKSLVEMMGGSISVKSEKNFGSEFTVIFEFLPVDEQTYSESIKKNDETLEHSKELFRGKKVLLVEDNEFNAEIATVILEDFGLEIEHANDGLECIELVKKSNEKPFDLILMDVQMPNMNGYETTKKIRKIRNKKKSNIPIIAMTANAFEEDKKKAFESGMNAHLAKPISSASVKNVLEQFLKK